MVSPALSNIYLNKLDEFVERELIPRYTRGAVRARNPEYMRMRTRRDSARRRGDRAAARDLTRQMRTLPSIDPMDPGYRRLRYIRYADDHILGFIGPKAEAEQIKAELAAFLRETLGLELSQDKTLISHARTQPARFLGYHIIVQHCDTRITYGRRSANGRIALRVPPDVIKAKIAPYRRRGKPWHRPGLQNLDAYDIVRIYGAEYRGITGYYLLAQDVWRLSVLCWYAQTSMLKTLAAKHKSSVAKMAARYKAKVITGHGPRTCFEARRHREGKKDLVARFGGIPLKHDRRAVIHDPAPARPDRPPPQGADPPAPQAGMRPVRARHHGGSPPGSRAQPARQARAGPARVGRPHGEDAAQDPHRLRRLPCLDPREPRRARGINRWRARCIERCMPGSEGGCPEKA